MTREDTDWEKVLRILTLYRLLSPGSEWRLHRQWFQTTALGDLLGVDARAVQDDTLYRCHDRLLPWKEELFAHLRERWSDLFGAKFEVLLYDLTSTYFECDVPVDEADPRRFGYSRDKRSNCVQVVVALVVTPEGLPLAYEMFPGNTADKTTLRGMLATIRRRFGEAQRIWVMDRGIPTEEVLAELRAVDSQVKYLVGTPKGRLTQYEAALAEKPWQAVRPQLRVKLLAQAGELYVLAESQARAGKERGMRRRRLKAYWKRLGELQAQRPKRDDLLKKLGAAQDPAGRVVTGVVKVEVAPDGALMYQLDKDALWRVHEREGRYLLRTNLAADDPELIWRMLHATVLCRGGVPHAQGRPRLAAHLSSRAQAHRGSPVHHVPRLLSFHHLAPATARPGRRVDGPHPFREARHRADARRHPAHDRRTRDAPDPSHRTGA